jgi:flagellar biosynthesis/type III secretory pathway M-ring protein FliF/YscJ
LQFEGATIDKKANEEFAKQYQQEQLVYTITSSVIPLVIVLILGCFALAVLKGFVSKMPTPKKVEKKSPEEILPKVVEEDEVQEVAPKFEFNKRELASQKEQTITEINEAVMAAPDEAAKLLTSFIRE